MASDVSRPDVPLLSEEPESLINADGGEGQRERSTTPQIIQRTDSRVRTFCARFCYHKQRTKVDVMLLILHLLNFCILAFLTALIVEHRKATKGLCLTASTLSAGGIINYNTSVFWCNLLLYACILSASVSWISIVVKWTAQAYASIRWLRVELCGNVLALFVVLSVLVTQSVRFGEWCEIMNQSMKPYNETYDMNFDKNVSTPLRCERNTLQIDKIYPEIVKLHDAYQFTIGELTLSCIHFIMWCAIVHFARGRLGYQVSIRLQQETTMRKETLKNAADEYQQFLKRNENQHAGQMAEREPEAFESREQEPPEHESLLVDVN